MATITSQQASLFLELFANAGWLDDADDLIGEMLAEGVSESECREKCVLIDTTIVELNLLVEPIERVFPPNVEQTLDHLLNN